MDNKVEKIDLDHVDWKSSREFFESLGEALDRLDDKDESYDFTWVGKRKSIIEAGSPISKTLRPDVEASKDFDSTKNMLIVGDNLDALKLLQESYLGKVKMIYIDPPYNTGSDFIYRDDFSVNKMDYEDSSTDEDGNLIISEADFIENSKSNGRFHSDWLSMIYPRLKLARNLLTDDGVIFISIGDDEVSNLQKVCDEIYGEDNRIGIVTRVAKKGSNQGTHFRPTKDYLLVYAKYLDMVPEFKDASLAEPRKYPLQEKETGRQFRKGHSLFQASLDPLRGCKNQRYYIEAPDGTLILPPGNNMPPEKKDGSKIAPETAKDKVWRWSQESYLKKKNIIMFSQSSQSPLIDSDGKPTTWNVYEKKYKDEEEDSVEALPNDIIYNQTNASATEDLKKLGIDFPFSKPCGLIKFLEEIMQSKSDDDYILDFFAGSGTTGQAVIEQNAKNGTHNKYILVQLNEKSDVRKTGFSTIDQITAERLRRAGKKIVEENPDKPIDVGFRVFRIDDGNEKEDIRKPLSEIHQSNIFDMVDNVKKDRTPLDLLFGVVYASALPFDLKLETRKIGDNTVYLYGYLDEGTGLAACFDDKVPEETVKEIAKLKTLTAAFKDTSFKDSAEKINLSEHFRIISPDTKVKVI